MTKDQRIQQLEAQIKVLEDRIADLELRLSTGTIMITSPPYTTPFPTIRYGTFNQYGEFIPNAS